MKNDKVLSVILKKNTEMFSIGLETIQELYFIEDVFSFCMTGKISFIDYGGVIEQGNIWGYQDEILNINYGINNTNISKDFIIYKIERQQHQSTELEKNNVFDIIFVSPLFFKWHYTQYSRSFSETKTTDIMNHIMKYMVGDNFVSFEPSNERIKYFYTGLKTPAENFKYLMERSTGVNSNKPGYLCFENLKGYNLVTLPLLMNNNVELMKPNQGDNKYYWFHTDNTFLFNKILSIERNGVDNSSRQQLSGGYRLGYDIKRKKNIKQKYSYIDNINKFKDNILGNINYPILDPSIENQNRYINTGEKREDFIDNIYYNNWIKQYSLQQTISIYVKGHQDRKAGGVIKIKWPSVNENKPNQNLTGKYFVKSIIHFFSKTPPYYNQKMVLMKNAYENKTS